MNEQRDEQHDEAKGVEAAVLRRRNLLRKSVILGVPLLLTLPGKAFARGSGSGAMSGNMSGGTKPYKGPG